MAGKPKYTVGEVIQYFSRWHGVWLSGVIVEYSNMYENPYVIKKENKCLERFCSRDLRRATDYFLVDL
jgi:hypothetical protein